MKTRDPAFIIPRERTAFLFPFHIHCQDFALAHFCLLHFLHFYPSQLVSIQITLLIIIISILFVVVKTIQCILLTSLSIFVVHLTTAAYLPYRLSMIFFFLSFIISYIFSHHHIIFSHHIIMSVLWCCVAVVVVVLLPWR